MLPASWSALFIFNRLTMNLKDNIININNVAYNVVNKKESLLYMMLTIY
jgi:hypothetical protein